MLSKLLRCTLLLTFSTFSFACCCRQQVRVVKYLTYQSQITDSLESIASRFGVSSERISEINSYNIENKFMAGRIVKIPLAERHYRAKEKELANKDPCSSEMLSTKCDRLQSWNASLIIQNY